MSRVNYGILLRYTKAHHACRNVSCSAGIRSRVYSQAARVLLLNVNTRHDMSIRSSTAKFPVSYRYSRNSRLDSIRPGVILLAAASYLSPVDPCPGEKFYCTGSDRRITP